jgi:hypothetical protein
MPDPSKPQSSAEKRKIDEKLDDALEESFPGSDPRKNRRYRQYPIGPAVRQ